MTHPVFYGDHVYKLRRVKSETNVISSGSDIVKCFRRRQYDPVIIERTIGLVLGPFTAIDRPKSVPQLPYNSMYISFSISKFSRYSEMQII